MQMFALFLMWLGGAFIGATLAVVEMREQAVGHDCGSYSRNEGGWREFHWKE